MVFRLTNAPDIDANHCDELFAFVYINYFAELPQFAGNEYQNTHWWGNEIYLTGDFKAKALDMVHKHNLHNCAVAINGCKKDYLTGVDIVTV
jgi:hypothetical protein